MAVIRSLRTSLSLEAFIPDSQAYDALNVSCISGLCSLPDHQSCPYFQDRTPYIPAQELDEDGNPIPLTLQAQRIRSLCRFFYSQPTLPKYGYCRLPQSRETTLTPTGHAFSTPSQLLFSLSQEEIATRIQLTQQLYQRNGTQGHKPSPNNS